MELLPTTTQPGCSDFDRQAAEDDGSISKAEEIRSEDEFDPVYEQFYGEPFLHYMRSRYCPYSIPSYFKGHHRDDDLFMDILGKSQLSVSLGEGEPMVEKEKLTKLIMVELIWRDTRKMRKIWNNKEMEHLYTTIIEAAACLLYFFYHQNELFRIGRSHAVNEELDEIWDQLPEDRPNFDGVCTLINQLISTEDKYFLVTEEVIADMIYHYPDPRLKNPTFPSFPVVAEEDKDKLYKDIANVVQELKPPPLEPDEYTHWMMTFLRGDALDVELNIMCKILDDRNKFPIERHIHEYLFPLFHDLLFTAKKRVRSKLLHAVLPLIKICQPKLHEKSRVMIEIVEVAELRRIAVGNQFIGRSHLIWAFYKLGYALPLEIRNRINFHDADEDHPPYHIYMAAAGLTLLYGHVRVLSLFFVFLLAFLVEWISRSRVVNQVTDNNVVVGVLLTVLHAIRTGLTYFVMLAVTSFNVGVFIGAVAGHALGFLAFTSGVFGSGLDQEEEGRGYKSKVLSAMSC